MTVLAQLKDADTSLTLEQRGDKYHVTATRFDSVNPPETVVDTPFDTLAGAIKAITIFYVQEWESVFVLNKLSEKMDQAISAT